MGRDPEPIFIFGAGGHGRSVLETVEREGRYVVAAVLDDAIPQGGQFKGIEILGGRERLAILGERGVRAGFVAIGDNSDRELVTREIRAAGLGLVTIVHPGAHVARSAKLGAGTVTMAGAVVAADARIDDNVILNTGCTVDHDCHVSEFAHLSPGVHVSGECEIGARAHIGIGASVVNRIRIGDGARIGAGAAVIADIAPGALAIGVPARAVEAGV